MPGSWRSQLAAEKVSRLFAQDLPHEPLLCSKAVLEDGKAVNNHRRITSQASSSCCGNREEAKRDGEQEAVGFDCSIWLSDSTSSFKVQQISDSQQAAAILTGEECDASLSRRQRKRR